MTHEPECQPLHPDYPPAHECTTCLILRAAYQRGRTEIRSEYERGYQEGFRAGYNAHAESRAHAEQMYGRYKKAPSIEEWMDTAKHEGYYHDLFCPRCNGHVQHGQGENP